jgi:serine/threonine protein kinase
MELMDGTLHELVKKKKTTVRLILQAFWQIAMAIRDINDAGYIHRDIKPQNILYREVNGEYIFKLCDFSGATHLNNINSPDYTTYPFAAPETMFSRKYNEKIDVWSLGISILWCFCRKLAGDTLLGCFQFFVKTFGLPESLREAAQLCFGDKDIAKKVGAPNLERSVKYVRDCLKMYGVQRYPKGLVHLLVCSLDIEPQSRLNIREVINCKIFDDFLDYDSILLSPSPARSPSSSEWRPFYDWNGAINMEHRVQFIEMMGELTRNPKILFHTFDIFDRIASHMKDEGDAQGHLLACYDLTTRYIWSFAKGCKSIASQYSRDFQTEIQALQPWILKKIKYLCYRTTYYEINGGVMMDWFGMLATLMDLNKLYLRNWKTSEI